MSKTPGNHFCFRVSNRGSYLVMSLSETDLEAIGLLMRQELEGAFDLRLEPFRREVNGHFDHVYKGLETLQDEHTVICEQLKRIETKLDNHEGRIQGLEKKVA